AERAGVWLGDRAGAARIRAGVVERSALDGLVAGIGDEAPHLFLRHAIARSRGVDNVLLDHDGSQIVPAEGERDLPDLGALRDPGALHVPNVVEVEARDRERLQILEPPGF